MRSQCLSFQALLIVGKQSEQFNFGLEWEEEFWRTGLLFFWVVTKNTVLPITGKDIQLIANAFAGSQVRVSIGPC